MILPVPLWLSAPQPGLLVVEARAQLTPDGKSRMGLYHNADDPPERRRANIRIYGNTTGQCFRRAPARAPLLDPLRQRARRRQAASPDRPVDRAADDPRQGAGGPARRPLHDGQRRDDSCALRERALSQGQNDRGRGEDELEEIDLDGEGQRQLPLRRRRGHQRSARADRARTGQVRQGAPGRAAERRPRWAAGGDQDPPRLRHQHARAALPPGDRALERHERRRRQRRQHPRRPLPGADGDVRLRQRLPPSLPPRLRRRAGARRAQGRRDQPRSPLHQMRLPALRPVRERAVLGAPPVPRQALLSSGAQREDRDSAQLRRSQRHRDGALRGQAPRFFSSTGGARFMLWQPATAPRRRRPRPRRGRATPGTAAPSASSRTCGIRTAATCS